MEHQRHFTLEEAREILPEVQIIVSNITRLKSSLDAAGYSVYNHSFFKGISSNGSGKYPEDLLSLIDEITCLQEKGVLIKDLNSGLIDFPCIRKNGQEVYLCYLLGEDNVNYWHRITEGFNGRKSVEEL